MMIKKLGITSIFYVSESDVYQVAKAETSREEQCRRGIDGRVKRSKSTQR